MKNPVLLIPRGRKLVTLVLARSKTKTIFIKIRIKKKQKPRQVRTYVLNN